MQTTDVVTLFNIVVSSLVCLWLKEMELVETHWKGVIFTVAMEMVALCCNDDVVIGFTDEDLSQRNKHSMHLSTRLRKFQDAAIMGPVPPCMPASAE